MIIKKAEKEDVEAISLLSFRTFKGLLISDLGIDFLKDFYNTILQSEDGIIYVLKDSDKIKGFICGIAGNKSISFSFKIRSIYYCLRQILVSPKIVFNLITAIKKTIYFKNISSKAELISIVVKEDFRNQGFGKMLVEKFCDFLLDKGIKRFKVFTKINGFTASSFYEKLNFVCVKSIKIFKGECRCYEKLI